MKKFIALFLLLSTFAQAAEWKYGVHVKLSGFYSECAARVVGAMKPYGAVNHILTLEVKCDSDGKSFDIVVKENEVKRCSDAKVVCYDLNF